MSKDDVLITRFPVKPSKIDAKEPVLLTKIELSIVQLPVKQIRPIDPTEFPTKLIWEMDEVVSPVEYVSYRQKALDPDKF